MLVVMDWVISYNSKWDEYSYYSREGTEPRTEPLHTFEMEQDPMVLAPNALYLSSVCGKTLAKG